jgi:cellulose synthase/poly-beta-1,6-N-acetylglucosamine synthase-like glycosyltransferase
MLEYVCFIITSFLFVYGIRMLIFLHSAWNHRSESLITARQLQSRSTVSLEKGNLSHTVTFNQNIISHDYLMNYALDITEQSNNCKFISDESGKNSNFLELSSSTRPDDLFDPVISIIVATNNEEDVIYRLLKSLEMLSYNRGRFEIIVVDDSTDSTPKILEQWTKKMKNLTIIRRTQRVGSKGEALNLALQSLRKESFWVIIIDADTILPPDIIEQFLVRLRSSQDNYQAIQGYCIPYNHSLNPNTGFQNWISRGIEFRLAQRNLIEFVARKKLRLPVQITGSLFMVKTSLLNEVRFSTDVCEDWDLTLDLYLREHGSDLCNASVLFDETLNARNQAPVSLASYFNQRLRVSEGHTRGFIKKIPRLILYKQPLKNKIEIFFTGFRYLRHLLILSLVLLDFIGLSLAGSNKLNIFFIMSFAIQFLCIGLFLFVNGLGLVICRRSVHYTLKFLMSELILEFCVSPALILGSLLGICRKKGSFHRTQRIGNIVKGS